MSKLELHWMLSQKVVKIDILEEENGNMQLALECYDGINTYDSLYSKYVGIVMEMVYMDGFSNISSKLAWMHLVVSNYINR